MEAPKSSNRRASRNRRADSFISEVTSTNDEVANNLPALGKEPPRGGFQHDAQLVSPEVAQQIIGALEKRVTECGQGLSMHLEKKCEQRLASATQLLEKFKETQQTKVIPQMEDYKRKLDEIADGRGGEAQKQLKESLENHELLMNTLFERFDKNSAAIAKCRKGFEKQAHELRVNQQAENAALLKKLEQRVSTFKKTANKSAQNQNFAAVKKSMMSLLSM
ncbi:uncharacterized protein EV422DRAFT_518858 [Fimicolochytrium jonesii]|uniref:uncharacterized protein n=1 Tax=Fimicolochytrium jonesii TaxID=1396493 RepID=UPI0022FF15A5|nr:uncharacterized protein EV422DRAFT_518858 [Fimicolochytrium jonesii]KAI8824094.1 hypothetical protein EV422DRAFT_518858 [Fimicolochytrium jonesii]